MDAAERLTVLRGIAAQIDYPSVYMGGPSPRAMKLAERVIADLESAGRLVSARCSHASWTDYKQHGTHCPTCGMQVVDAACKSSMRNRKLREMESKMPEAPTCRGSIMLGTACMRCERCRRERERIGRLFSAAERVERWWVDEGMHKFDGAPECIFALRDALSQK